MKSKLLRLFVVFVILAGMLAACGDVDESSSDYTDDANSSSDTYTDDEESPADDTTSSPAAQEEWVPGSWLVMLYQDADDEILEEDIFTDLNEAERVGSTDQVSIVAQIDRTDGGFEGEQDFTTAKRFFLTQDDDLNVINSEEVEDLGEVNMADGQTLVDFVTWATSTYPADHYVLILSDHGTGWPGGWTDADNPSEDENISIDGFDDMLYMDELESALADIQQQTGIEKFDIIGFDACLMGSLEVFTALAPYADYAVASQETEPSMGWAYYSFLSNLTENPDQTAASVATNIVDTYIVADTFIIDEEARTAYAERTYDTGDISEEDLAAEETKTVTLAAIDLSKIPAVVDALNQLATAMGNINQKVVANARSHARSFESVFGDDYPSPYIDLGNLVKLIKKESTSPNVAEAADLVKQAMDDAVIQEMHGDSKKGSTGISIYFPNSDLFGVDGSDFATYTRMASRFAEYSLWDDFLAFHYTGQEMPEAAETVEILATPQAADVTEEEPVETIDASEIEAPGAGEITMADIEISSDTASVGSPSTLYTTINGENVSYIYVFTGLLSDDGAYLQVIDIDFLDSEETYEIDGMIYPDWGDTEIPIEFDWEPVQYVIYDGETYAQALLEPDTFGAGTEDTFYSTDGIYTFANGDDDRYARLYFNGDGELVQVIGYADTNPDGPMHEITPENGDQFTIIRQWIPMEGDSSEIETDYGDTLTFGDTLWTWEDDYAPSGEYIVGFFADDMDGNRYEVYTQLTGE